MEYVNLGDIVWHTSSLQPNSANLMLYLREQSEVIRHKSLQTLPSEHMLICTQVLSFRRGNFYF